ncbi:unannotated protein [freshwater metagenome]|uniref:Unannotated protein n=1 Tax=freshwater metagenome TaxID=449393 RepID=A0A6J7HZF9_9ZZZZ
MRLHAQPRVRLRVGDIRVIGRLGHQALARVIGERAGLAYLNPSLVVAESSDASLGVDHFLRASAGIGLDGHAHAGTVLATGHGLVRRVKLNCLRPLRSADGCVDLGGNLCRIDHRSFAYGRERDALNDAVCTKSWS